MTDEAMGRIFLCFDILIFIFAKWSFGLIRNQMGHEWMITSRSLLASSFLTRGHDIDNVGIVIVDIGICVGVFCKSEWTIGHLFFDYRSTVLYALFGLLAC